MPDVSALAEVTTRAVVGASVRGERHLATVGDTTDRSVFRIASLTKTFTATAAVRALHRAGVPLETPVIQLLPELTEHWSAAPDITVEHLLAQTSGLHPGVTGADAAATGSGDDALAAACRLVAGQGSDRAPGERWDYYNGNYFLVGRILAAVTGTTYEAAVEQFVLGPAGLSQTSFLPPADLVPGRADGAPVAETGYPRARRPSGGLVSSASDLLTFLEQLLADEELLTTIGRDRTRPDDPMRYGLGWATGPSGQLYLNGRLPGYRTAMLLLPEQRCAVVGLANDAAALPALADVLSRAQESMTGDDLSCAIDAFAA